MPSQIARRTPLAPSTEAKALATHERLNDGKETSVPDRIEDCLDLIESDRRRGRPPPRPHSPYDKAGTLTPQPDEPRGKPPENPPRREPRIRSARPRHLAGEQRTGTGTTLTLRRSRL